MSHECGPAFTAAFSPLVPVFAVLLATAQGTRLSLPTGCAAGGIIVGLGLFLASGAGDGDLLEEKVGLLKEGEGGGDA